VPLLHGPIYNASFSLTLEGPSFLVREIGRAPPVHPPLHLFPIFYLAIEICLPALPPLPALWCLAYEKGLCVQINPNEQFKVRGTTDLLVSK